MKKVLLIFSALFILASTFASTNVTVTEPVPNANKILIPIGKTGTKISLMDLSKISRQDLELLTGKKMSLLEKLSFKSAQKKLKKHIAADGTLTGKKITRFFEKKGNPEGFHALGFLLGFLLGLIGVVLAYVINDDEDKHNRVKWSWIGFGVAVVLYLVLIIAVLNSVE